MTTEKLVSMTLAAVLLLMSQPGLAQDKASDVNKKWIVRGTDDGGVRITHSDGSVLEGRTIRFRFPSVGSDTGEHWFVLVGEEGGRAIVASDYPEDRKSVARSCVSAKVIVVDLKNRTFQVPG